MADRWSFLSSHGLVLMVLARDPDQRLRHVAEVVGITERHVSNVLGDLVAAGLVVAVKSGRQNRYSINVAAVGPFAQLLVSSSPRAAPRRRA